MSSQSVNKSVRADKEEDVEHEAANWMRIAIERARGATIRSSPNPRVGCVVVRDGILIGAGHSAPAGGPHAEVQALAEAGEAARGAQLFVTLEPCSHWGKTPPCVDAILKAGVREVYFGLVDPDERVQGRGAAMLRAAGVKVTVGLLREACERLHAPFLSRIERGRPWVSLKGAMSLDGQLATASGDSQWITGLPARQHVHEIRAQVDAVLVGGGTARADLPQLTVRHCPGEDPLPVVLSRHLELPSSLPLIRPGAIFFHAPEASADTRRAFEEEGVRCREIPLDAQGRFMLQLVLEELAALGINHLLVEGGGETHGAFLDAQLADDLYLYLAPKLIGCGRSLFAFPSPDRLQDAHQLEPFEVTPLGDDLLLYSRFRWNHSCI